MGNEFGDAKKHQIVGEMYSRLRRVIERFCRSEARNNVLRAIQNFVPHLKRMDKDVGSLPLYSDVPTSRKTNREHCLLCVLSYTVQKFWDYRDKNIASTEDDLLEIITHIAFLERVAKQGLAQFRVHGKYPKFSLVHVDEIEALEAAEEVADQELAARVKQENVEATAAEREGPIATEEPTEEQVKEDDKATTIKNAVEVRAAKKQTATEAIDAKADEAMQKTAEECSGECDTCTDRVCDKQLGSPDENQKHTAALKELGYIDAEGQEIVDESGEDTGDEGEDTVNEPYDQHPADCDCEACYGSTEQDDEDEDENAGDDKVEGDPVVEDELKEKLDAQDKVWQDDEAKNDSPDAPLSEESSPTPTTSAGEAPDVPEVPEQPEIVEPPEVPEEEA